MYRKKHRAKVSCSEFHWALNAKRSVRLARFQILHTGPLNWHLNAIKWEVLLSVSTVPLCVVLCVFECVHVCCGLHQCGFEAVCRQRCNLVNTVNTMQRNVWLQRSDVLRAQTENPTRIRKLVSLCLISRFITPRCSCFERPGAAVKPSWVFTILAWLTQQNFVVFNAKSCKFSTLMFPRELIIRENLFSFQKCRFLFFVFFFDALVHLKEQNQSCRAGALSKPLHYVKFFCRIPDFFFSSPFLLFLAWG